MLKSSSTYFLIYTYCASTFCSVFPTFSSHLFHFIIFPARPNMLIESFCSKFYVSEICLLQVTSIFSACLTSYQFL